MENEEIRGEVPDMGKMQKNCNMSTANVDTTVKELNKEKRRLKEMEEEDAALRKMQAKVEKEIGCIQDPREEVDCRSIFVGNVDYACTPQEVQQHFQSCGMVNRVTILTDKFGRPKGFAFVEFVEFQAVDEALRLNKSKLHGRQLKVSPKRTNVPGMKQNPPNTYGYGKVPRFTRPTRYRPYN